MWLAYKLFEISTMADGQESSTRYITMDASSLPSAANLEFLTIWRRAGMRSWAGLLPPIRANTRVSTHWATRSLRGCAFPWALGRPSSPGFGRTTPSTAPDTSFARHRRTNLALVQTARMWAQTVKHLDSLPHPEARAAACAIRDELTKLSRDS